MADDNETSPSTLFFDPLRSFNKSSILQKNISHEAIHSKLEISPSEISSDQDSSLQPSIQEVSLTKFSSSQNGITEISIGKISSGAVSPTEIGCAQVGKTQVYISQVSTQHLSSTKVGLTEVGTSKINTSQVSPTQINTSQIGIFHQQSGETKVLEVTLPSSIPPQESSSFNPFSLTSHSLDPQLTSIYSTARSIWHTNTSIDLNFAITNLPSGQLAKATITGYDINARPNAATISIQFRVGCKFIAIDFGKYLMCFPTLHITTIP